MSKSLRFTNTASESEAWWNDSSEFAAPTGQSQTGQVPFPGSPSPIVHKPLPIPPQVSVASPDVKSSPSVRTVRPEPAKKEKGEVGTRTVDRVQPLRKAKGAWYPPAPSQMETDQRRVEQRRKQADSVHLPLSTDTDQEGDRVNNEVLRRWQETRLRLREVETQCTELQGELAVMDADKYTAEKERDTLSRMLMEQQEKSASLSHRTASQETVIGRLQAELRHLRSKDASKDTPAPVQAGDGISKRERERAAERERKLQKMEDKVKRRERELREMEGVVEHLMRERDGLSTAVEEVSTSMVRLSDEVDTTHSVYTRLASEVIFHIESFGYPYDKEAERRREREEGRAVAHEEDITFCFAQRYLGRISRIHASCNHNKSMQPSPETTHTHVHTEGRVSGSPVGVTSLVVETGHADQPHTPVREGVRVQAHATTAGSDGQDAVTRGDAVSPSVVRGSGEAVVQGTPAPGVPVTETDTPVATSPAVAVEADDSGVTQATSVSTTIAADAESAKSPQVVPPSPAADADNEAVVDREGSGTTLEHGEQPGVSAVSTGAAGAGKEAPEASISKGSATAATVTGTELSSALVSADASSVVDGLTQDADTAGVAADSGEPKAEVEGTPTKVSDSVGGTDVAQTGTGVEGEPPSLSLPVSIGGETRAKDGALSTTSEDGSGIATDVTHPEALPSTPRVSDEPETATHEGHASGGDGTDGSHGMRERSDSTFSLASFTEGAKSLFSNIFTPSRPAPPAPTGEVPTSVPPSTDAPPTISIQGSEGVAGPVAPAVVTGRGSTHTGVSGEMHPKDAAFSPGMDREYGYKMKELAAKRSLDAVKNQMFIKTFYYVRNALLNELPGPNLDHTPISDETHIHAWSLMRRDRVPIDRWEEFCRDFLLERVK
ncbi:hypothetical protein KIPB_000438 [Kipferlia bialata]|uniref:Uncharacterized protein n=1 Tax=Kipferlia bialata TaxID=797122 RepID=A0A9K3CQH7_9EUKA|nr:hypothetical protein KIPB_000438 [Kipferlia bialata]|eukprot:g438.t1